MHTCVLLFCVCLRLCVCVQVVVQAVVRDFLPSHGSRPNRWQLDYADGPCMCAGGKYILVKT